MISKPANYDSISENGFRKLEMGGYVGIIRKVTDVPNDKYLEIEYDIAEGEFKNIAADAYEQWGNWNYKFRIYYSEKSLWRLKKFISRVEQTNPNFTFDWNNVNCLVNKGIGLIIGMRQYWGKDGTLKEAPDVQDFCTAKEIREGNLPSQPKVNEPRNSVVAASTPAFAEVPSTVAEEEDIPF